MANTSTWERYVKLAGSNPVNGVANLYEASEELKQIAMIDPAKNCYVEVWTDKDTLLQKFQDKITIMERFVDDNEYVLVPRKCYYYRPTTGDLYTKPGDIEQVVDGDVLLIIYDEFNHLLGRWLYNEHHKMLCGQRLSTCEKLFRVFQYLRRTKFTIGGYGFKRDFIYRNNNGPLEDAEGVFVLWHGKQTHKEPAIQQISEQTALDSFVCVRSEKHSDFLIKVIDVVPNSNASGDHDGLLRVLWGILKSTVCHPLSEPYDVGALLLKEIYGIEIPEKTKLHLVNLQKAIKEMVVSPDVLVLSAHDKFESVFQKTPLPTLQVHNLRTPSNKNYFTLDLYQSGDLYPMMTTLGIYDRKTTHPVTILNEYCRSKLRDKILHQTKYQMEYYGNPTIGAFVPVEQRDALKIIPLALDRLTVKKKKKDASKVRAPVYWFGLFYPSDRIKGTSVSYWRFEVSPSDNNEPLFVCCVYERMVTLRDFFVNNKHISPSRRLSIVQELIELKRINDEILIEMGGTVYLDFSVDHVYVKQNDNNPAGEIELYLGDARFIGPANGAASPREFTDKQFKDCVTFVLLTGLSECYMDLFLPYRLNQPKPLCDTDDEFFENGEFIDDLMAHFFHTYFMVTTRNFLKVAKTVVVTN